MSASKLNPIQKDSSGPLVIGAGLMRTGTNSQMKALEILLPGRCYHMEYILRHNRAHLKLWYRAASDGLTKELADEILTGFQAVTDFPTAFFYRELMQIYPDAKFVLSVRDPKRWALSVKSTIALLSVAINGMLPITRWLWGLSYYEKLHDIIFQSRFGFSFDMSDDEMIQAFNRHVESVTRTIPKDRLLVFQVTEGWEPLCQFLDLPVPDVPFPNVNDSVQFQEFIRFMRVASVTTNLAVCSAAGAVAWFGLKSVLRRFF